MYRFNIKTVYRNQNVTRPHLDDSVRCFDLFPGIHLYIMDLFSEGIDCEHIPEIYEGELIAVNHCEKGRFEGQFSKGEYVYLGEGDVSAGVLKNITLKNAFPLSRFKGIIIIIETEIAKKTLEKLCEITESEPFDLDRIKERLLSENQMLIYRNNSHISSMFSGMYDEAMEHRELYLKIKVLEILLELSSGIKNTPLSCRYFERSRVEAVKNMRDFMIEHLDRKYTQEELSKAFSVPLTSLKECFKAVYGSPVNTYMREYRMNVASSLLRETNLSVAEISERVGYANQSKFAEVFKERMRMSPVEYRNKI